MSRYGVRDRVLDAVRRAGKGGITIPDLARTTQTGKATARACCQEYVEAGVLRECDFGHRYVALGPLPSPIDRLEA